METTLLSQRLKFGFLLTAFLIWCGALVSFRMLWTRSFGYAFLLPNLFLASLPLSSQPR